MCLLFCVVFAVLFFSVTDRESDLNKENKLKYRFKNVKSPLNDLSRAVTSSGRVPVQHLLWRPHFFAT